MPTPTAFEQEMLEYINRARLDPQGEFDALIVDAATRTAVDPQITSALRYFDVDLALFQQQLAGLDPAAPLAWNTELAVAAEGHSLDMIAADTQAHQLPGGPDLGTRVEAAGYDGWSRIAENIFAYTESAIFGHAGFYIDWGTGPGGIQSPPGHRENILSPNVTEVGIAAVAESDPGTQVGPWVVTQNFGTRWDYQDQLLGVVIDDQDGDRFYDAGEGLGGVTVTAEGAAGSFTTTTWSSGGYQMPLVAGSYTVTFSGGGLGGVITETIVFGDENMKLDALAEDVIAIIAQLLEGGAAGDLLAGQAGDDTVIGYGGDDSLSGGDGADRLDGGAGGDDLDGGAWLDKLDGGAGDDALLGGDGIDWLWGRDGDDRIEGGAGRDVTFGGAGADVFVFSAGDGADTIGDFEIGIDRLLIENLDTATAIAVAWGNGMRIEWGADSLYLVGLDAGTTDPEILWGP